MAEYKTLSGTSREVADTVGIGSERFSRQDSEWFREQLLGALEYGCSADDLAKVSRRFGDRQAHESGTGYGGVRWLGAPVFTSSVKTFDASLSFANERRTGTCIEIEQPFRYDLRTIKNRFCYVKERRTYDWYKNFAAADSKADVKNLRMELDDLRIAAKAANKFYCDRMREAAKMRRNRVDYEYSETAAVSGAKTAYETVETLAAISGLAKLAATGMLKKKLQPHGVRYMEIPWDLDNLRTKKWVIGKHKLVGSSRKNRNDPYYAVPLLKRGISRGGVFVSSEKFVSHTSELPHLAVLPATRGTGFDVALCIHANKAYGPDGWACSGMINLGRCRALDEAVDLFDAFLATRALDGVTLRSDNSNLYDSDVENAFNLRYWNVRVEPLSKHEQVVTFQNLWDQIVERCRARAKGEHSSEIVASIADQLTQPEHYLELCHED